MKLVIVPAALAELHDAAAFYTLKANANLGLTFVAEFERAANSRNGKPSPWFEISQQSPSISTSAVSLQHYLSYHP